MNQYWYFFRHVLTNWNKDRRVQGQIKVGPIPIKEELEKTRQLAESIRALDFKFGKAYCSTSPRAIATSEPFQEILDLDFEYLDDFVERGFGNAQGKLYEDAGIEWYLGKKLFESNSGGRYGGVEPLRSVNARADRCIEKFLESPEQYKLMIGHEWMIAYTINRILGESGFKGLPNLYFHHVEVDENGAPIRPVLSMPPDDLWLPPRPPNSV